LDKTEIVQYWLDTANNDYKTMLNLYESKDYNWSLFIGHLVIEKLLKALYVKNIDINVPRIHDLLRLAEKSGLPIDDDKKELFDIITTFNLNTRYPDYKQSFYNKCTYEFTTEYIEKIKELRLWLLSLL